MNFQFQKEAKVENEVGVVRVEGGALAQSCVSLKMVEMNFQFWKEEKLENELCDVSMEGAAVAKSYVSLKMVEMNFQFRKNWNELHLLSIQNFVFCQKVD